MKREIVITADGSSSIHLPDWNEQYHSKHGAIQEAYHVFIKHGLQYFWALQVGSSTAPIVEEVDETALKKIAILEIGFGTGLNSFITLLEAKKLDIAVDYVGVEAYPVSMEEVLQLNYPSELKSENQKGIFLELHKTAWEKTHGLSSDFFITKQKRFFHEVNETDTYDIVYFDAFGARVQPELWTEAIFEKMYGALRRGGVLVTYAAKGSVRRAMQAVGFKVEKLPGPPGKREMLRGSK